MGENYLFAIGIDKYKSCSCLNNAVLDVRVLMEILTSNYQFQDDEKHLITLFNENATRKNVYKYFRNLQNSINENDSLLIYFSGHGYYEKDFDGFWIPAEARVGEMDEYIENTSVIKFIKNIKAKHILIIADSCFSGALFLEKHRNIGVRPSISKLEELKSRWAFSSGRLEFVSDGISGEHSPFAKYLIKFLKEPNNHTFTTFDIVNYVRTATEYNSEQIPRGEPLKDVGDEGGEFIFRKQNVSDFNWSNVKRTNTIESYLDYLDNNPNTKYKEEIFEAIELLEVEEDTVWNKIISQDKISAYLKYTSQFPNGRYIAQANNRISELKIVYSSPTKEQITKIGETKPKIIIQENKNYPIQTKSGESKFDIFRRIGELGRKENVQFLMSELIGSEDLAVIKLVDFALGLVHTQEGINEIEHFLFHGNQRQRNYAALYFKRIGYQKILNEAVRKGLVTKSQAFNK